MARIEQGVTKLDEAAEARLQACELTELKRLQDDDQYAKAFGLGTAQYIQLEKIHEEAQDTAQNLA